MRTPWGASTRLAPFHFARRLFAMWQRSTNRSQPQRTRRAFLEARSNTSAEPTFHTHSSISRRAAVYSRRRGQDRVFRSCTSPPEVEGAALLTERCCARAATRRHLPRPHLERGRNAPDRRSRRPTAALGRGDRNAAAHKSSVARRDQPSRRPSSTPPPLPRAALRRGRLTGRARSRFGDASIDNVVDPPSLA